MAYDPLARSAALEGDHLEEHRPETVWNQEQVGLLCCLSNCLLW